MFHLHSYENRIRGKEDEIHFTLIIIFYSWFNSETSDIKCNRWQEYMVAKS